MPIDPSQPDQSALLFLSEATQFLREAQENGDYFVWRQEDEEGIRRLVLEIEVREYPENSCCQPVFTSEGGIVPCTST